MHPTNFKRPVFVIFSVCIALQCIRYAQADPLNLPVASGGSVRCVNERFGPVGETLEVNHYPSALLGAAGVNSVAKQGQLYMDNCNIFSGAKVTDLSSRTTINVNTREDPYRNTTTDGINDDIINVTITGSRARFLIVALMGSTSSSQGTNPISPAYRNRRVVLTIEHSTLRLFAIEVRDRFMPNNYSSLYYYGNRCQQSVAFGGGDPDCQRRKVLDEDYAAVTIILRNNSFIEGRTWNDIEHLIVFGSSSDKSGGIAIYVTENSIEYGDVANSGAGIIDVRVGSFLEYLILHLSANNVSIKNTYRPLTMPTALVYFHEGLDLRSPRVLIADNSIALSTDVGLGAVITSTAWLGVVALSGWTGYSVISHVAYTDSSAALMSTQRSFARARVSELIVRSNTVAGGGLFVGAALQVGAWSTVRYAHNTVRAPLNTTSPAARADIFNTTDRVAVLAPTGRLELRSLRVLAPRQAPSALVRRLVNNGNGQVVLCSNYFERAWYSSPAATLVVSAVGVSMGGGCTATVTPTRSHRATSSRSLRDSRSRSALILTSTHTKTLTFSTNKTRHQSNTTGGEGGGSNNTNASTNVGTDGRSRNTPLEPPTPTAAAVTDLLVIIGAFTAVFSPFLFDALGGIQVVAVLAAMPCGAPGAGSAGAMRVFLSPLHVGGGRTAAVAGLLVLVAAVLCAYGVLLAVAAAALRSVRRAQQLLKHPQIFALLHALALPGLAFESAQLLYGNERPTAGEQALGALVLVASLASVAAYPAISAYFHHRVAAIATTTVACRLDSETLAAAVPRVVSAALVPPMAWAPEVLASPRCVYGPLRVQRGRVLRWLSAHSVGRSMLVAVIAAVRPVDADHCSAVLGAVAAVCVGHAAVIAVMRPYRVPVVNVAQGCVSALAAALAVVGAAHGSATAGSALAIPLVVTAFAGVLCAVAAHVLAASLDLFRSSRKSQRRSLASKGNDLAGAVEINDGDDIELRHHTDSCSTPSTDPQKLHRPEAPPASVAVAAHSGTIEESDVVMVDGNNQRNYFRTDALVGDHSPREVEHTEDTIGGGTTNHAVDPTASGPNPLLAPPPNRTATATACRGHSDAIHCNRVAPFDTAPLPLVMAAHQHSSIVGTSDARRQQLQQGQQRQLEQQQQQGLHDSHLYGGGGGAVLPASVSDGRGGGVFYIDGRLFHLPSVYIPTTAGDDPLSLLTAQSAQLAAGGGGGAGRPRNPNSFSARTFEPDVSAEGGGQNTDGTTTDATSMVAFERFERSRFV